MQFAEILKSLVYKLFSERVMGQKIKKNKKRIKFWLVIFFGLALKLLCNLRSYNKSSKKSLAFAIDLKNSTLLAFENGLSRFYLSR